MSDAMRSESRLVLVRTGSSTCAIPASRVVEYLPPQGFSELPALLPQVVGMATYRDQAIPLVDPLVAINQTRATEKQFPKWLVVTSSNEERCVLGITTVIGMIDLNPAKIRETDSREKLLGLVEVQSEKHPIIDCDRLCERPHPELAASSGS